MKNLFTSIALCLGLLTAGGAQATLMAADGGNTVYDTDLNIYWTANANINGQMTWYEAQNWIASLNSSNYLGYNDWRLPTSDTCGGYNCTSSEMGHLFYTELGGNSNLFSNVQTGIYWSGTEYALSPNLAWTFDTFDGFQNGYQNTIEKANTVFAWAVRPGQVAAVPEPGTEWLLGIGLLGLMGVARRRLALR